VQECDHGQCCHLKDIRRWRQLCFVLDFLPPPPPGGLDHVGSSAWFAQGLEGFFSPLIMRFVHQPTCVVLPGWCVWLLSGSASEQAGCM
jgi:hypothetical protein